MKLVLALEDAPNEFDFRTDINCYGIHDAGHRSASADKCDYPYFTVELPASWLRDSRSPLQAETIRRTLDGSDILLLLCEAISLKHW